MKNRCSYCKYLELIPLFHVFGVVANCEHPESKMDPETTPDAELENCELFEDRSIQRDGEVVSRVAHNHEIGGSNPSPATSNEQFHAKLQ